MIKLKTQAPTLNTSSIKIITEKPKLLKHSVKFKQYDKINNGIKFINSI